MTLELYHWEPTVNSGELLICLNEKKVAFVSRYVDLLAFEQHSPQFLALNPRGEVPVLVHDGHVLTETTVILEYLDETFPGLALVPEAAGDRYRMRVWTKLADDYLAPALTLVGCHQRLPQAIKDRDRTAIDARLARLPQDRQVVWRMALDDAYTADQLARANQHLDVVARRLEEQLGSSPWLAGDCYSLADIAMYPAASALQALRPNAFDSAGMQGVLEWLKRMRERPAVQAALGLSRSMRPEEVFAPGPELGRWG
jgi:GSH-dependent disulfide-bond oxidoreductase